MKLPSRLGLLAWLVFPAGLLGVCVWWDSHLATEVVTAEVVPLRFRRFGPAASDHTRIPEHSAYRVLMPGNEARAAGVADIAVTERVHTIRRQRCGTLEDAERGLALDFLSGKITAEGVSGGQFHWLADEILTSLRLQEPPWDGLAAALAEVAFQPQADPVIRDYITQHLGHLWEQHGWREEIEVALWKAVESGDETTPGSALIALHRGYQRDGQTQGLARVVEQSLEIARNSSVPLASRVTALAIAGEDGGSGAKELARDLVTQAETPVLLRKVAENVLAR